MKKKLFATLLCLIMVLPFLPISARADTTVSSVSFTLEYPEAGKTPPGTATWLTSGYSIHSIEWYDRTESRFLDPGETVKADHQYKATLWVEAMDGYSFACEDDRTPSVTAYINGTQCTVTKAYEYKAWAMICVTYSFPAVPAKGWIKSVNLTVPAPVAGERPSYTQLSGNSYASGNVSFSGETNQNMKNGIAWYAQGYEYINPESGTFGENTAYTFHCLLFPLEGYRMVPGAAVYVNGNRAEASLDYDHFLSVSYQFPATGTSHTHVYTDWAWNSGQHYKNCTDCDDVFFVESHKGGTPTCESDGICSVCGYAYIPASEDYHTPDTSKWVARGDMYHFHPCSICGAHCDPEDHRWSPTYLYQDSTGHAWICADCKATSAIEKHNPGPAATETSPQTCKDCGYVIAPAKNHVHDLTKVPQTAADCINGGNIEYYFCTGCNDCFTDAEGTDKIPETMSVLVDPLGHTTSESWSCDGQYHWRTCETCGILLNETKMLHDGADGKCATCGYDPGTGEVPQNTEAEKPGETAPEQTDSGIFKHISLPVIILVALICFAMAITVTVIVPKMK